MKNHKPFTIILIMLMALSFAGCRKTPDTSESVTSISQSETKVSETPYIQTDIGSETTADPEPFETMNFGKLEQDENPVNGKDNIVWYVLKRDNGKVLLMSKYILDCKMMNENSEDATWKESTLRTWLNGEFFNEAFTAEEQARIIPASLDNDVNDKVFLLSMEELRQLIPEEQQRCAPYTDCAKTKGANSSDNSARTVTDEPSFTWWLRAPGASAPRAYYVNENGVPSIASSSSYANSMKFGVRPVIWIKEG